MAGPGRLPSSQHPRHLCDPVDLPIFQTMVALPSLRTLIADLVAFILPINNFVE
jgi:hypothetical protein